MIPIEASEETREQYIRNIITTWYAATPGQLRRGRTWYRTVHDVVSLITDGHIRAGAGVIAALSANKPWAQNRRLARQAYRSATPRTCWPR
ncbi:hypothetical protein [Streptomyces sp. 4F14]|uniref:DUF7178 family protein n=1 Tax=Streptomyces sp. 4F14 TaxID=3394380 RepID=UPI003A87C2C7